MNVNGVVHRKRFLTEQEAIDYKKQLKTFHALHDNHPIIDVLYKREKAYESLEENLNVRIPRDQEASSILNMDEECYKNEMRVRDPMKMNWDLKV